MLLLIKWWQHNHTIFLFCFYLACSTSRRLNLFQFYLNDLLLFWCILGGNSTEKWWSLVIFWTQNNPNRRITLLNELKTLNSLIDSQFSLLCEINQFLYIDIDRRWIFCTTTTTIRCWTMFALNNFLSSGIEHFIGNAYLCHKFFFSKYFSFLIHLIETDWKKN